MSQPAYREERGDGDWVEPYRTLVGPDDWSCTLTEPEYRIWSRDLSAVVDKLNELHADVDRWSADYAREQVRSVQLIGENHVLRQQMATLETEIDRLRREWRPIGT